MTRVHNMSKELFTSQIVLFQNRRFGYFTVAFISGMQKYRTKTDINTNQIELKDMGSVTWLGFLHLYGFR